MFSSLPDYSRFAEATLQRLRSDHEQKASDPLGRMMFNLVLVAGLWGVLLYARWMVLSDMSQTQRLPEAVLGKWQMGQKGDERFLEFTPRQQLYLIRNGVIIESADYQIAGDVLMLFGFKLQPGNCDLEIEQQCYRISIQGGQLIVTSSDRGFTAIPEHTQWERSRLRIVLPQFHGAVVKCQRADNQ